MSVPSRVWVSWVQCLWVLTPTRFHVRGRVPTPPTYPPPQEFTRDQACTLPLCTEWLDRPLWKHYLPATTVAGGNKHDKWPTKNKCRIQCTKYSTYTVNQNTNHQLSLSILNILINCQQKPNSSCISFIIQNNFIFSEQCYSNSHSSKGNFSSISIEPKKILSSS